MIPIKTILEIKKIFPHAPIKVNHTERKITVDMNHAIFMDCDVVRISPLVTTWVLFFTRLNLHIK